jgi:hypothetical protein
MVEDGWTCAGVRLGLAADDVGLSVGILPLLYACAPGAHRRRPPSAYLPLNALFVAQGPVGQALLHLPRGRAKRSRYAHIHAHSESVLLMFYRNHPGMDAPV